MRLLHRLVLVSLAAIQLVAAATCAPGSAAPVVLGACTTCLAGYYSPGGSSDDAASSCKPCPANTYGSLAGASSCTQCAPDFQTGTAVGQVACTACATGTSTLGNGLSCSTCPNGSQYYKPGLVASVVGPLGALTIESNLLPPSCRLCPAGSSSTGGANCASCPSGSYAPVGSSSCTAAPAGSFAAAGAATSTVCAVGTYSTGAQASCTACASGTGTLTTGSASASACVAQTAGTALQNGQLITCPAGTSSAPGDTTCSPCTGNTISTAGSTCTPCPSGQYNLLHTSCAQIPAGSVLLNGALSTCSAGSAPNADQTSCQACTGNTIAIAGAVACTLCGPNQVTLDHISCSNVEAGNIFANGQISACPIGTTSNEDRTSCVTCVGNTIAAATGSPLCTPCNGEEVAINHATCQLVAAGSIYSNGQITLCPKGTTSDATKTTCVTCSGNTIAPVLGSPACESCPGTSVTIDNIGCIDIPAGSIYHNGRIDVCAAGTAPNSDSSICSPCSGNTIAPIAGSATCTSCADTEGAIDGIRCDIIPDGSIYVGGRITACAAGTSNDPTRTVCTPCTGNTIAPLEGTVCSVCPALQATTDHIQCSNILPGYILQSDILIACEAGTTSDEQHLNCVDCIGQTIAAEEGSECVACPGMQETTDHITCNAVPSARRKRSFQRSDAFLCPVGKQACYPQSNKASYDRTFECIDTVSNAVACGGCPVGYEDVYGQTLGEDCSQFDDNADARCVKGKCHYTCSAGWKLVEGLGCVKRAKAALTVQKAFSRLY